MDISTFRQLVDETATIIAKWPSGLIEKYQFLDLPQAGSYTTAIIGEELFNRIRDAFHPRNVKVAEECRGLICELIYGQILDHMPLNPCCELLATIKDATQHKQIVCSDTNDEWRIAVQYAHLSVHEMSPGAAESLTRTYPEYYSVAYAAIRLNSLGYLIDRGGRSLRINSETETRLIKKIESIISEFGGLRVASKIGSILSVQYDPQQERYHLISPKPTPPEPQQPKIPLGYLLQLAVKNYESGKPCKVNDQERFNFLIALVRDYATILQVQDYSHFAIFPYEPIKLIEALQKKALEDSIYKIAQVRPSDVTKILLGLFDDTILDDPFEENWTIRQAIVVIDAVVNKVASQGLSRIFARDVRKKCPTIDGDTVNMILSDVLSHPRSGANQSFSKPSDAPNMSPNHTSDDGADFFQLPLLRYTDQSYILLNKSFCSGSFVEAIFTQMRNKDKNFDRDYLGKAIECFTRELLLQHKIKSYTGHYCVGKTTWECDIVIETIDIIILIEVKKKPLTRRARAGSDISLVLDLAQSLLDAQKQAGNHEMQLRKEGHLDLLDNCETNRIELKGRKIERIALSFTDFGSFHDRVFLEKFLIAISQLKFSVRDSKYEKQFEALNKAITSLQDQHRFLYPENNHQNRSYFNCWFFSLPQLMIILDGVTDAEEFRDALWATRGMSNGHGDLCFDIRYAEQMKKSNPEWYAAMLQMANNGKTFVTGF